MPVKRHCTICDTEQPEDQFKPGLKRWICRKHYNEKWRRIRKERWARRPHERQAHIAWQMAYRDSTKVFMLKIAITPAQVATLRLDSARLLPIDPTRPLSMDNHRLVSAEARMRACRAWARSRDAGEYAEAIR